MSRLYTKEEFKYELFQIHRRNIEIIGEYINKSTKTKFKCNVCENEWDTSPFVLTNNKNGCPKCAKEKLHNVS